MNEINQQVGHKDELKWLGRFGTWKYIPNRYQALVASIVSALLYYNIFEVLFKPQGSSSGACGSLFRPVFDDVDKPLWIWDTGPWSVDMSLGCPRHIYGTWWELILSFAALAVCGSVLRRSIRRAQQ